MGEPTCLLSFNSIMSKKEKHPSTRKIDEGTNNKKEGSEEEFLILSAKPILLNSTVFLLIQPAFTSSKSTREVMCKIWLISTIKSPERRR